MEIQKGCVATVSRYDSALHSNAAFSGSAEVIENASGSLSVNGSANPAISIEDCGDIESIEYRTHRNNNSIERQDFDPVIKELVLRDCLPSCPYQLPSCLHRTPFQRECVPPELRFLQIPGEEFEAALRIIRESPRVRFFTPLNHKVLHLLILFVVFLVVWLIGFALWRLYPVLPPLTSAMLCLPVATLLVIIVSCLCGAWRHKAGKNSELCMVHVNELLFRHHVVAGLVSAPATSLWPSLSVHFVCIDIAPCMSVIASKHHLLSFHKFESQLRVLTAHLTTEEDSRRGSFAIADTHLILESTSRGSCGSLQQEFAREVSLFFCDAYVNFISSHRRPTSKRRTLHLPDSGHSFVRPCLCQFVMKYLRKRTDRVS